MKLKKIISFLLICALLCALSLTAMSCGDKDDDGKDTKDSGSAPSESDDPVDTDSVIFADKATVTELYRSATQPQSTIIHSMTNFNSVTTQKTYYTKNCELTSANGKLYSAERVNEELICEEYCSDDEYIYIGGDSAAKVSLSDDDEKAGAAAVIKDKYYTSFDIDDFESAAAMDNSDGTFTFVCSKASEDAKNSLDAEVKSYLDRFAEGYTAYSIYDISYQLTVNSDGIVTSYLLSVTIKADMPVDTETDETADETSLPFDMGGYFALTYIAVVEAYDGDVAAPAADGAEVTDYTYNEYFK